MHTTIVEQLHNSFYDNDDIKLYSPEIEKQLAEGQITSYNAANKLLDKYFKR
jgi:hypothetical protein